MLTCLAIDIKPGVQRHDVTYFNFNDIWELRQWYSAQICPFITTNTYEFRRLEIYNTVHEFEVSRTSKK